MAQLALTGTVMILRPPAVTAAVQHLGYPAYFPVFLGMAKLLAVAALAQRWSATLSEWAYAGISFDLLAAGLSHLASHDATSEVAGPFFIMILVALSYVAYGKVRRLNSTQE